MSARFLVDGVPQGGVIVGDIGQEVPESRICSYFGPKSSKSGWKYQARTSPEEQDAILSLYRRVYECQDIPNKEITVQFARGLILMSEGTKVDWKEFRVSRRKYCEGLRRKKELTQQFVRSENEGEGSVPSIIGKRRCLALQGGFGDDFPPSLKLTVKSEGASEGLVAPMGKRGGGKGRPLNVSPAWIQGDIDDMVRVIGDRSVLLDSLRVRRSRQIVIECDQTIGCLEKELEATCDEHNNLSQKVEALEKQAVDMEEQLRMMREGFGDTFWPMPIDQCPEFPIHLVHTLNPCPVCHLWYSCWDYVPIGCGHCYHPWCLAEHAKVSLKCLLRECGKSFDRRHQVALGIRIPVKASVISVKKEVLQASHSFPAATEKRKECTPIIHSLEVVEGLEKTTLGLQSSATNVVIRDRLGGISNLPTTCYMCNQKDVSVRLKACGHVCFCFLCIQGLQTCPVCHVRVSGWEPIPKKLSAGPKLPSSIVTRQIESNPVTTKSKDLEDELHIGEAFEGVLEANGSEFSYDSGDEHHGNVHWSAEDVFFIGGPRSVSVEEMQDPIFPVVQTLPNVITSCNIDNGCTGKVVAPERATVVAVAVEAALVHSSRKRSAPKKDHDDLNHTRVVKRTMDELLSVTSNPTVETEIQLVTKAVVKRKPGRPTARTKAVTAVASTEQGRSVRNTNGRQVVPAKFR